MKKITKNIVLKSFEYMYTNLYEKDKFAIENNSHEQCISGRIAMYLREFFIEYEKDGLRVDVEYNRDKNDPKLTNQNLQYDKQTNPYIRPDILFHVRGNNEHNIIYCEIKKNNDIDKSKVKIQVKTRNYCFGIVITKINKKESEFFILEKNDSDFERHVFTPPSELKNRRLTNEQRIFS